VWPYGVFRGNVETSERVNRFLSVGIVFDFTWIIVADNCFAIESNFERVGREVLKQESVLVCGYLCSILHR